MSASAEHYDEPAHYEPFGPEWVRLGGDPCPNCPCCTKRLCELATSKPTLDQNCAYHGERALWDQLTACPCPRAAWSDAQRVGTACVFCGKPVDRDDIPNRVLIGMNGGLVAACVPCMNAEREALKARLTTEVAKRAATQTTVTTPEINP
jgi:hypothetical protein